MQIARRLDCVRPSLTMAIDAKAKQFRAEGRDVVGLAAGEPDFDPPLEVEEAAIGAIRRKRGRYTGVAGTLELRTAISRHIARSFGLDYAPDRIVVTSGAKQAIFNALYVVADPGDEVLIPAPYWTSYPEMALALGLKPVLCPPTPELGLDIEALKSRIGPKTRAIIVNSPSNPTGCVLGREELIALAAVVRAHPMWVISDDIYSRLTYREGAFQNLAMVAPDLLDRFVLIDGMSKTYCMTGWRVGFAAGPKNVIDGLATIQSHSTSSVNTIAQIAATEALEKVAASDVRNMVEEYRRRAEYLCAVLRGIEGIECRAPDAAFYAFPRVSARFGASYRGRRIDDALGMADALLEHELVAGVPGEAFGAPEHMRFSFATSHHELERAAERLTRFFAELR